MALNKGDINTQKITVVGILAIVITVIACILPSILVDTSADTRDNQNQEKDNLAKSEDNKEKDNFVTLTATIFNKSCADVIFDAYFTINDKKANDSVQTLKIPAGGQTDLTYNCIIKGTQDVKYMVSTDDILVSSVSNFFKAETFHTLGNNYSFLTVALISGPVVLVMLLVYLYSTGRLGKNRKKK